MTESPLEVFKNLLQVFNGFLVEDLLVFIVLLLRLLGIKFLHNMFLPDLNNLDVEGLGDLHQPLAFIIRVHPFPVRKFRKRLCSLLIHLIHLDRLSNVVSVIVKVQPGEDSPQVEVAAAELDRLRPSLDALQVDSMRELFECLVKSLLSCEQTAKGFVKTGSVPLNLS